jgi:hypothetical protein
VSSIGKVGAGSSIHDKASSNYNCNPITNTGIAGCSTVSLCYWEKYLKLQKEVEATRSRHRHQETTGLDSCFSFKKKRNRKTEYRRKGELFPGKTFF